MIHRFELIFGIIVLLNHWGRNNNHYERAEKLVLKHFGLLSYCEE